jgi:hypothetical protein
MAVLKKVPVQWASVITPSTQFDHQWEIQVELTKDQADALKEEAKAVHKKGIKIKEEGGKFYFRFRRKVKRADGTDNSAPVVIGPDGKPFTQLIGNGSICNVQYGFVAYKHAKFGEGVTNDLKGVRVIEHVPYGERDGDGLMDDDDDTPTVKKSHHSSNEYDDDDDL